MAPNQPNGGYAQVQKPKLTVDTGDAVPSKGTKERPNKLKVQAMLKSTDNKAKGVDPKQNEGKKKYYPVIFSRKETFTRPDKADKTEAAARDDDDAHHELASIVHQTDRNGTPKHFKPQPSAEFTNIARAQTDSALPAARPKGFAGFIQRFCSCIIGTHITNLAVKSHEKLKADDEVQHKATGSTKTAKPASQKPGLLGEICSEDAGKKCLVLDLDETLVHSSFKPIPDPDYVIPVEIEGTTHKVYVRKRPKVDEFLVDLAKHFEIVVYTASLSKYADPLLDQMDKSQVIRYRLFREHCVFHEGSYVKDLSLLGRDISQVIFIDNSPMSYIFQPRNAIGCTSFIDDMSDRELDTIKDFLKTIVSVEDVRSHLSLWDTNYRPYL